MNRPARIQGLADREAIESRFARNIAARLSERAQNIAPEIRLRCICMARRSPNKGNRKKAKR